MKKVIILLVLSIVFLSGVGSAFADNSADSTSFTLCPPQAKPTDGTTSDCPADPSGNYITDFTRTVTVTFSGLDGSPGDYKICYRKDYCLSDYSLIVTIGQDKLLQFLESTGVKGNKMDTDKLNTPGTDVGFDNFQLTVCGRGNGDLYANGGSKGQECAEGNKHYFHAGHSYEITVYKKGNGDNYLAVAHAGFYVNHGIPTIKLDPEKNFSTKGTTFNLSVSENPLRFGGKNNNNYQVVMEGPGYKKEECDWLDDSNNPRVFSFPLHPGGVMHYSDADKDQSLLTNGFTLPGNYIFKISEQINEGKGHNDDCQGGHTYMKITCNLTRDPAKSSCTRKEDPNGDDASDLLALLAKLNGAQDGSRLPCSSDPKGFVTDPTQCKVLNTSIGPIELDVVGFTTRLFSIVLTFAGIGAMILIIFAGYRLLLSRGNKEVIQGARQTLTSAIIGLFFIIFSLVLLSFIAGDILKIPGFK